MSIIQHFSRGELNYVIYFGEVENPSFTSQIFTGKMNGGFNRGTETGC